jgi:hypothetical protein
MFWVLIVIVAIQIGLAKWVFRLAGWMFIVFFAATCFKGH